MIFRIIIIGLGIALAIYYLSSILQYAGVIRFTKEKMTFWKILVPFYYFFAEQRDEVEQKPTENEVKAEEVKPKVKRAVKPSTKKVLPKEKK